jgi:methionyl-tRNA formyltransferase
VRQALDIGPTETAGELHDRLASLGAAMLVEHLDPILDGSLEAVEQDSGEATYAPKITTADARIDWSLPAADILRRIRAFNPVPGAWCVFGDERIKCWWARSAGDGTGAPGRILEAGADGIVVACGEGRIALTELQRPGRGRVSAREFASQLAVDDPRFD